MKKPVWKQFNALGYCDNDTCRINADLCMYNDSKS